tara:strand:+ start:116 stop:595 length:480 start_codon:yes stop_codon:yes gene_type:complete
MKKIQSVEFFSQSQKWSTRLPKLKEISLKTIKKMSDYFNNENIYNLNLIFTHKKEMIRLNKKFKNKYKDTDVLTFVSKRVNKELGKFVYCDIFFSIDTIEFFIKENKLTIYDHFAHLLIHSVLHINGYNHKNIKDYNLMKLEEIKILENLKIKNPYEIQ